MLIARAERFNFHLQYTAVDIKEVTAAIVFARIYLVAWVIWTLLRFFIWLTTLFQGHADFTALCMERNPPACSFPPRLRAGGARIACVSDNTGLCGKKGHTDFRRMDEPGKDFLGILIYGSGMSQQIRTGLIWHPPVYSDSETVHLCTLEFPNWVQTHQNWTIDEKDVGNI